MNINNPFHTLLTTLAGALAVVMFRIVIGFDRSLDASNRSRDQISYVLRLLRIMDEKTVMILIWKCKVHTVFASLIM